MASTSAPSTYPALEEPRRPAEGPQKKRKADKSQWEKVAKKRRDSGLEYVRLATKKVVATPIWAGATSWRPFLPPFSSSIPSSTASCLHFLGNLLYPFPTQPFQHAISPVMVMCFLVFFTILSPTTRMGSLSFTFTLWTSSVTEDVAFLNS
ncbi:hypothetical protein E2C01_021749 [Portunus trituberculatus]|uniref:Uncharacterized protein n=1 Tax=Portunus trituberculatus TaxID=210409 RepID=A0A5B7E3J4_PORTR|nr:hypothetical protein [Portunus trituberculatus]